MNSGGSGAWVASRRRCQDFSRGVQDFGGAAIVVLQADNLGVRPVVLEAENVGHVGPPPGINRLVIVSHDAEVAVAQR